MCGRFAVTLPPDAMAQLFQAVPGNDLPGVITYRDLDDTNAMIEATEKGGKAVVKIKPLAKERTKSQSSEDAAI